MTTLIVGFVAKWFGTKAPKPAPSAYTPSRRVRKIHRLIGELKMLKRWYKTAGGESGPSRPESISKETTLNPV